MEVSKDSEPFAPSRTTERHDRHVLFGDRTRSPAVAPATIATELSPSNEPTTIAAAELSPPNEPTTTAAAELSPPNEPTTTTAELSPPNEPSTTAAELSPPNEPSAIPAGLGPPNRLSVTAATGHGNRRVAIEAVPP